MSIVSIRKDAKALLEMSTSLKVAQKKRDWEEKVIALRDACIEERNTNHALREELSALKEENDQLKAQIADPNTYHVEEGISWLKNDEGKPEGKPLCSACIAKEAMRIPLAIAHTHILHCPGCPATYRATSGASAILTKYQR